MGSLVVLLNKWLICFALSFIYLLVLLGGAADQVMIMCNLVAGELSRDQPHLTPASDSPPASAQLR